MTREDVQRLLRKCDMMCSGHAVLRDRFRRRALWLDLSILALTTWLAAMAFVEPTIGARFTPFALERDIWLGLLAVGTFFLSLLHMRLDWKAHANAHAAAVRLFSSVTQTCRVVLGHQDPLPRLDMEQIRARYDAACDSSVGISEREFLNLKRHHLLKVALSRHLDEHPSTWPRLVLLKWWIVDNLLPRKK